MKKLKTLTALVLTVACITAPIVGFAEVKKESPKPYPLEKCIVSDEKLGGHGDPYVFVHEGQEIKMCCKSCLKDFEKDSAKYIKKLDGAAKAEKK